MSKCLLFDNDGTLVDSEHLSSIGLAMMFENYRIKLDADELVIRFRGWKLASILSLLEEENNIKLKSNFVAAYRDIVTKLFIRELKPVEGVADALEALDGEKAVVSSGPLQKIKHALDICGLSKYFGNNLFSSYEVGIWKPDPGIYLHAAKSMGHHPENCSVIDDGPVGVKAGKEAGMKTYFFNRFNEESNTVGVVSFLAMRELPKLIGN
ncbi:HAD-IA family hydrolase [Microbulbifer sp. VAAF005]|uniref:HAD-IA family hydrolase n=1 Tax=Microbulbifer sp. VAAF005 TaxID=3034230 RepID=UPI0024ACCBAB|nr:HAD-IA family hydrolase [Microbulbifer sp. VAAF005]WHI47913.1 HAD-IA family hydrolase [Microbulbifer sp. VAAF005]